MAIKPIVVKFKRLHPDAVMPVKRDGDAGWDFVAPKDMTVTRRCCSTPVPTGIAVEMPEGYYLELFMRSSYGSKTFLRLSNCVGLIDNHYRGEIMAMFDNLGNEDYIIHKGERFCQGVVKKEISAVFQEVDELNESDRGQGGFGSTGK